MGYPLQDGGGMVELGATLATHRNNGTVSSMTSVSLNLSSAKIIPKKVKCTCDTSGAMQTKRVEALKKKQDYKIAFKHASSVYAIEKAKKGGMSAFSVSTMIKKEFNVDLTA